MKPMKISKYNIVIPTLEEDILYNCRTDVMVQVNERLMQLYQKYEQAPEEIGKIAPPFYEYLCNNGFIVEQQIDETELIIGRWVKEDTESKNLNITVNPTMNCNLKCWYCYEKHRRSSYMKPNTIHALVEYLKKQIHEKKYQQINLSFFGGEPLLYFQQTVRPFLDELEKIKSNEVKFSIHFTTNATLLTPEIFDYLRPWKPDFQITLDGDEFIHNLVKKLGSGKRSAYQIVISRIKMIAEHHQHVLIRLNYTAKTLERFINILDDLKSIPDEEKQHCNISFHRIWQDNKIPNFELRESLQKIEDAFRKEHFFVDSQTSRVIDRCYADKENSIVINYDGAVYKCTARDFNAKNREGQLLSDGGVEWNARHEQRQLIRYGNDTCKACILFAICHGGCSQTKLETEVQEGGCLKGFTNEDKIDYIRKRIEDLYNEHKTNR